MPGMAVRDHGVAIQFGDAAITGAASPSILRIAGREVLVRTRRMPAFKDALIGANMTDLLSCALVHDKFPSLQDLIGIAALDGRRMACPLDMAAI